MDFLNHREGVWFSIRSSSFLLYKNCKRLRAFEKIEISSKAIKVTVNKMWKSLKTFVWISSKNSVSGHNLFGNGYLCSSKICRTRKQKYSFLIMEYSALFHNVFEAWNLIKKYLAEIQLPGDVIRLHSIPKSSTQGSDMACHWRIPTHQLNYKCSCS
jgi:hypothetical protein